MSFITSAPFRAKRLLTAGIIRPVPGELAPPDGVDPAFRADFPGYCAGVLDVPDNVVDLEWERKKRMRGGL